MTIMDRRRALMGAEKSGVIALKDLNIGDYFKVSAESSHKLIVFQKVSTQGVVLVAREYLLSSDYKIGDYAVYDGSGVDVACNSLSSSLTEKFANQLADFTFETQYTQDGTALKKNITRKIFAPKAWYLDNAGTLTAALKVFYNTSDANTARKARKQGGSSGLLYWTCDSQNGGGNKQYAVSASGAAYSWELPYYKRSVRPVFSMQQNAKVKLINGEYILQ